VRRETEIAALPQMIEQIHERGLRLKTVSDVLRVWQPDHAGA
jgi:peptidoglycan/xylan/chitin deacetylase (PgdA/CDA1 family)